MENKILDDLLHYVESIFNFNNHSVDDSLFVRVLSEALVRLAVVLGFNKEEFLEAVGKDWDYFSTVLEKQPEPIKKKKKKKILN
jgi:hypothetical protein